MNFISKTCATLLSLLSLLGCSCVNEGESGDSNSVAAVYVTDNSGNVVATFGYKGSVGRPCRMDHPDLKGDAVCKYHSDEPIQAAVNWAVSARLTRVYLDAATYTFNNVQSSFRGRVAIHIPGSIQLCGVMRNGVPASVITPSQQVIDASLHYDITLLLSGSIADPSVPLNQASVESVYIDNQYTGAVCLWTGGGVGLRLTGVHAQGSTASIRGQNRVGLSILISSPTISG